MSNYQLVKALGTRGITSIITDVEAQNWGVAVLSSSEHGRTLRMVAVFLPCQTLLGPPGNAVQCSRKGRFQRMASEWWRVAMLAGLDGQFECRPGSGLGPVSGAGFWGRFLGSQLSGLQCSGGGR